MATGLVIIDRMKALANRSGTMVSFSFKDDLLRVYVLGSGETKDFVSRAQWVTATFAVLLEEETTFRSDLEKTLGSLSVTYHIWTQEDWSLGIAEISAKIFASKNDSR